MGKRIFRLIYKRINRVFPIFLFVVLRSGFGILRRSNAGSMPCHFGSGMTYGSWFHHMPATIDMWQMPL